MLAALDQMYDVSALSCLGPSKTDNNLTTNAASKKDNWFLELGQNDRRRLSLVGLMQNFLWF